MWRVTPRESTSLRSKRGEWWPDAKATEPGGGCFAVTEPGDEDQVKERKAVPYEIEVRGKDDRNKITTFRQCRTYTTVIQGGSAIPKSRATGATTSTITRECDRPIDERKGLPTVQVLSETAKQERRKEGKVTMKPLQPGCQSNMKIRRESEGRGVVVASPS